MRNKDMSGFRGLEIMINQLSVFGKHPLGFYWGQGRIELTRVHRNTTLVPAASRPDWIVLHSSKLNKQRGSSKYQISHHVCVCPVVSKQTWDNILLLRCCGPRLVPLFSFDFTLCCRDIALYICLWSITQKLAIKIKEYWKPQFPVRPVPLVGFWFPFWLVAGNLIVYPAY